MDMQEFQDDILNRKDTISLKEAYRILRKLPEEHDSFDSRYVKFSEEGYAAATDMTTLVLFNLEESPEETFYLARGGSDVELVNGQPETNNVVYSDDINFPPLEKIIPEEHHLREDGSMVCIDANLLTNALDMIGNKDDGKQSVVFYGYRHEQPLYLESDTGFAVVMPMRFGDLRNKIYQGRSENV